MPSLTMPEIATLSPSLPTDVEAEADNAALVARNVHAMLRAIDATTSPDVSGVLDLHAELMRADPHHVAGAFREEQVLIDGHFSTPVGAHFVPPHHDRVAAAMDDLSSVVRRPDLPRLTQLAVAHAQFETIHPFSDGNGRTGRADAPHAAGQRPRDAPGRGWSSTCCCATPC